MYLNLFLQRNGLALISKYKFKVLFEQPTENGSQYMADSQCVGDWCSWWTHTPYGAGGHGSEPGELRGLGTASTPPV